MKLYYNPVSTYSQKALLALHEKGVAFEPEIVKLTDEAARAKYRELHPLGKIPLLVLDDGWLIPESSIIIEYLDTHHGGPRLIPEDPDLARQTRFLDRMVDLYLDESVTQLLFQSWKPEAARDSELIERSKFRAGVLYDFMEHQLESRSYLAGDDLTMADCAAAPALFYAPQVFPFEGRPKIEQYWQRLQEWPSYQKVAAERDPVLAKMMAAGS